MNPLLIAALAFGCLFGAAVAYLIWQLVPATPALGPALARLDPDRRPEAHPGRKVTGALTALVAPDPADLAVLGKTRGQFAMSVAASALVGLLIAPLLAISLARLGAHVTFAVPAVAGLLLAAAMALIAVRDLKTKAVKARRRYRKGVKAYINQVASAVVSGYGPVEALERAASVGTGEVFDRIRATLNTSRHQQEEPWDQLRTLGATLRVPALGDLGDNMQAAGANGADVYDTLRDAAASLRDQIRFDELAAAKKGSTALDALGAALLMVGIGIAVYPFLLSMQIR
ncbi:type II secretion system F family protein [Micromonospora sp. DT4]|uniref:type II secretion system F family protein n=1 Tax=Micromonospora sp. DT4 TaxID=3393438 RepID=UPI003CF676C7